MSNSSRVWPTSGGSGLRRIRTVIPKPAQPLARRAYLRAGPMTSRLRMVPSFIVIGGQRCGTTSLFKSLSEHPQVMRPPVEKGTDYFTLYYYRGLDWYRGHFPLGVSGRLQRAGRSPAVAFEACTYYMFHPLALERLSQDLPSVKLVAMLRDPVERAFSAYKHELARGFETEPDFERALDLEDTRLAGEVARIGADNRLESFAHRHHAYQRRGCYVEQLERAFTWFSREQIHVLDSETFFADPASEYAKVVDFLGLDPHKPQEFVQHNARPSRPMPQGARDRLREYYEPYDRRLEQLLNRRAAWRP